VANVTVVGDGVELRRDADGRLMVWARDEHGRAMAYVDESALLNALFDSSHLDQAATTGSLVKRYIEAKAKKATLDALSKEVGAEITALNEQVVEHFADQGVKSISIDGKLAYRHSQLWAWKTEDSEMPDLVAALQSEGLAEMATINSQSFSSFVRERLEQWRNETGTKEEDALDQIREGTFDWERVIPGLGRYIKVTEKVQINLRKA